LYKDHDVEFTMSEHIICLNFIQMSGNEGRSLGSG